MPPGVTISAELDGYADQPASGVVELHDWVTQDGQTYGDGVDISAPVTAITDLNYGGVVDTTANAPLAGATITLDGPFDGLNGQLHRDHRRSGPLPVHRHPGRPQPRRLRQRADGDGTGLGRADRFRGHRRRGPDTDPAGGLRGAGGRVVGQHALRRVRLRSGCGRRFRRRPGPQASVPVLAPVGPTTDFDVQLVTDPQYGTPIAGLNLNDPATQTPIAWTFAQSSDTAFTGIPDGAYDLAPASGWKLASGAAYQQIDTADVASGGTIDVQVVPNSVKTTPPSSSTSPTSTTTTTAAGGGAATTTNAGGTGTGSGHPLPFTGVDIVIPVLAALVLIGGGLTVLLFVRRRRATS